MKLYLVTANDCPDFFVKAENESEATRKYKVGLKIQPENLAVREITTIEELLAITPEEFLINKETSF